MYVNPIVAVALGALLLGEPVTMATVVATVAILGSVGLSFVFDPARRPAARGGCQLGGRGGCVDCGGCSGARTDRGAGCGADPAPSAVPLAVPTPAAVMDPAAVIEPAPAFATPPIAEPAPAFAPSPAAEPAAPRADA